VANRLPRSPMPLNFLLNASETDLSSFELARLSQVATLRKELHDVLDKVIDEMCQASMVAWFRQTDRQTLKRAIECEEGSSEEILEWAKEKIRTEGRNDDEIASDLIPRPALAPGAAHLAAAIRYQQRQREAGLCAVCPEPLARNSVKYCEEHLAMQRARYKPVGARGSRPGSIAWLYDGVFESMHGRQPGTLAALAKTRERQHRTTEKEKLLYNRIAQQLGVSPAHVRCVARGQRRSESVSAAIREEIEQEATEVLATLAEASEKRPKKRGREASSAFGVPVKTLIG